MYGIIILGIFLLVFLGVGISKQGRRFFLIICMRFVIIGILLYGVNIFLSDYSIYIPINEYTLLFSGLLGIPGIAALIVLQKTII